MASFEIKHKFVSPKPDGSETDLLRPSDWNAEHDFVLTGSGAVARLGTGPGPAEFVPFGTGANEIPLNSHLGNAAYATLGNAIGNALQVVDVGEGVAGLPTLDARNLTNLPLPEEGPLPVASTSQQGIVQLTNDFDSAAEDLAVTPKALSDGLASKPGFYEGSSADILDYPIGTIIPVFHGAGPFTERNGSIPIHRARHNDNVSSISNDLFLPHNVQNAAFATQALFDSANTQRSQQLSGTWRNRGLLSGVDTGGGTVIGVYLAQRVL